MWICLNDAFLSIVKNRNDDETLLVRARSQEHLDNVFPDCESWCDEKADYPFRAYIERDEVAKVIGQRLMDIQYPNFKNSVEEEALFSAYHYLWERLAGLYQFMRPGWSIPLKAMLGLALTDYPPKKSRQTTLDEFEE